MQNRPPKWDEQALRDGLEFVRLGFGDLREDGHFYSHDFRTQFLPTRLAHVLIRSVATVNGFVGDAVANGIARYKGKVSGWSFGREGSPVLYVRFPHTTNQIEDEETWIVGPRISEREHLDLVNDVQHLFIDSLGADEVGFVDGHKHELRIWWG